MPRGGRRTGGVKVARERLSQLFLEVGGKYVADEDVADATLVDLASASTPAGKAAYLDFAWWLWKEDAAAEKPSSPYFQDGGKLSAFSKQTDRERCIAVCMSSWDSVPAHHTVKRALGGDGISRRFVLTLVRYFKARLGRPVSFDSLLQMEPSPDSVRASPIANKSMSSIPVKEIDVANGNGHADGSDVRTEQAAGSTRSDHVSNAGRKRPTPRTFPKEMARFLSDFQLDAGLSDEGRALLLNLGSKFEPFAIPSHVGSNVNLVKGFELLALGSDGESYPILLDRARRAGVESLLGVALFKVALLSADALYNEIESKISDQDWCKFRFSINVDSGMLMNTAFLRLIERAVRRPYQLLFEASEGLRIPKEVDALFVILNEADNWAELALDDTDVASLYVREKLSSRTRFIKVDRAVVEYLYGREQDDKGKMIQRIQSLRMGNEAVIVEGVSSRDMKRYLHKNWNVSSHGELWMQGYHMQLPPNWTQDGILVPLSSTPESPEGYVLQSRPEEVVHPRSASGPEGGDVFERPPASVNGPSDELQAHFEKRLLVELGRELAKPELTHFTAQFVARFAPGSAAALNATLPLAEAFHAWWGKGDAADRLLELRKIAAQELDAADGRPLDERTKLLAGLRRLCGLAALGSVSAEWVQKYCANAHPFLDVPLEYVSSVELVAASLDENLTVIFTRGTGSSVEGNRTIDLGAVPEKGWDKPESYVTALAQAIWKSELKEDRILSKNDWDLLRRRLLKGEDGVRSIRYAASSADGHALSTAEVRAAFSTLFAGVGLIRFHFEGSPELGDPLSVKEGTLLAEIQQFLELLDRHDVPKNPN